MKIIELLNKIANGEEVPKRIKFYDEEFVFTGYDSASKNYNNDFEDLFEVLDGSMLNKELEILEEEKKIPEKIYCWYNYNGTDDKELTKIMLDELRDKSNEIIDYLDYLKSKGDE